MFAEGIDKADIERATRLRDGYAARCDCKNKRPDGSCCIFLDQTYLSTDGDINSPLLRKARLDMRRRLLRMPGTRPYEVARQLSEPFTDDNPPCMCACHREGVDCLH